MTEIPCIGPERVGELLALPESHALRVHARTCPRCAALLDEYRLFMEMGEPDEGADPDSADVILSGVIAGATRKPVAAASPVVVSPPRPDAGRPGWIERLLHPALRPAWAFAALAVALGGVLLWPRLASPPEIGILRGESGSGAFAIQDADFAPIGVRLTWRSWPGAERYQARFLSIGLREIGRAPETADTTLFFAAGGLPARAASGDSVLVRVAAMAGTDVVAITPPRLIVVP